MKMNNDYQIKGRCSLYTSLFLIGMDIYFSSKRSIGGTLVDLPIFLDN